jgi:hypothetical protein
LKYKRFLFHLDIRLFSSLHLLSFILLYIKISFLLFHSFTIIKKKMSFNNNTTTTTTDSTVHLPVDKTRRKRLKVVSACSECRRKKTKCNGEKPCAGCIKTNMDCKYSNSPKSKPVSQRPLAASSTLAIHSAPQRQPVYQSPTNTTTTLATTATDPTKTTATIQAIENRLGVIEDILQILLKQQQQQQQQQPEPPRNSAFLLVQPSLERNMHVHHSAVGPYYGGGGENSGYHDGLKRKHSSQEEDEDDAAAAIRLPPPIHYQPTLSESSSTSTTSSICSSTSPKMNTIQNLLNSAEENTKLDYHQHRPSAFYRPGAGSPTTTIIKQDRIY